MSEIICRYYRSNKKRLAKELAYLNIQRYKTGRSDYRSLDSLDNKIRVGLEYGSISE